MSRAAMLALALLACLGVSPEAALAQGGPGAGGPPYGAGGRGGMFASIDTNGDGLISRDEFKSHVDSMFAVMDQGGTGKVSKEQFLSLRMGPGGGFGPNYAAMQSRKAARFDEMDANHDGTIDKAEFETWEMARFDKADTGHKGVLTRQQFRAMDRW